MMNSKDRLGLIIVSVVAIILMIGLIYKSYDILSTPARSDAAVIDSSLVERYQEEIKAGPALVEIDGKTKELKESEEKVSPPEHVEVKKETPKSPVVNSKSQYIVITGSFGSKTNAEKWKAELERKSYQPDIYFQKSRGLYHVYVQSFEAENKAENYARALKKKGIECHIKKI